MTLEQAISAGLSNFGGLNIDAGSLPRRSNTGRTPDLFFPRQNVLMELKSIQESYTHHIYNKIFDEAARQGQPMRAYGQISTRNIIDELPNPEDADRRLATHLFRRVEAHLSNADKQLGGYARRQGAIDALRVALVVFEPAMGRSGECILFSPGESSIFGIIEFLFSKNVLSPSKPRFQNIDCLLLVTSLEDEHAKREPLLRGTSRQRLERLQIERLLPIASAIHSAICRWQPETSPHSGSSS